MTTFVFPGQGSQKVGMGEDLFDRFPDITAQADDILGLSIKALCLEDTQQQLNQTLFTQPALYVVNALHYFAETETSEKPSFVAGHSLGEYNALLSASVFDFATGLKLVKKRAELMSQATGGGMAAIIGLPAEQIETVLSDNNLNTIDIANYNAPEQIVVTGLKADIEHAIPLFETGGAKMVIPLSVSGAFHSRYMDTAQKEFRNYLNSADFNAPKIPVIANINAQPYELDTAKDTLANQINHSVRWVDTIQYLMAQGEADFKEVGPGKVLTGLIRRISKLS